MQLHTFIKISLLAILFGVSPAVADDDVTPSKTDLMPSKKVTIIINKVLDYVVDYDERPCVDENMVNLIPGEKVFIEADEDDGKLTDLKRVEKIEHKDRTLVLELKQSEDRKRAPMTYLLIKNPFDQTLKYSAEIQPYGKEQFYKTSVAPIPPGKYVYEVWYEPVLRVLLENFELTD